MIHILISGNVQGVGFRQFVKYQAKKLNIKGWVRNLPDGNVEGMLVGDEKNLQKMIEICRIGPMIAEVKNLEIEKLNDQNFYDFQIIKE